jgi:hypothetical protein
MEVIAVDPFVFWNIDTIVSHEPVPRVIHPDQDGEQIRLEVDGVAPDPRVEIHDPVAADAAIIHMKAVVRAIAEKLRGRHGRISRTERMGAEAGSVIPTPPRVGDGIALKEYGGTRGNQRTHTLMKKDVLRNDNPPDWKTTPSEAP